MELLLARKASLDIADSDGFTPLLHAALRGSEGSLSLLLRAGAALSTACSGVSASALATIQGHSRVVAMLEAEAAERKSLAADAKAEKEQEASRAAAEKASKSSEQQAASSSAPKPEGGGAATVAPMLQVSVPPLPRSGEPPAKVGHRTKGSLIIL